MKPSATLARFALPATLIAAVASGCTTSDGDPTDDSLDRFGDHGDEDSGDCGGGPVAKCEGSTGTPCDDLAAYITSQADFDAIAGCSTLKSLYVHNTSPVTAFALPNLVSVEGAIYFDRGVITTFSAPCLTHAGEVEAFFNDSLLAVELPGLLSLDGDLSFGFEPALASLEISALESVGGIFYVADTAITRIDAPALTTIGSDPTRPGTNGAYLYVNNNPQATSIDLGALASVGGYAYIARNPSACAPTMAALDPITADYVYLQDNGACL